MASKAAERLADELVVEIDEACDMLKVKPTKLYEMMKNRVIAWARIGGRRKISVRSIKDHIAEALEANN